MNSIHHEIMIDVPEEPLDFRIQNPVVLPVVPSRLTECIQRWLTRSIAVRVRKNWVSLPEAPDLGSNCRMSVQGSARPGKCKYYVI
ncbi:MAG: hypothetical protein KAT09_04635 [Candidatus Aegiribacteria sp.]|nr:hypothetical protein [Candidatus Aegiribacteria sp.]